MPCYHPLLAYRAKDGSRRMVFNPRDGFKHSEMYLPCGQCIGCRIKYARDWAIRCVFEASQHQDNCFITLTYDDKHLPDDLSVHVDEFQRFMKRLRRRFEDVKIRFFHCGEYGEKYGRPHYHAILFGFNFPDLELFREYKGQRLYTSKVLSELWPYGFVTVGECTYESCQYVARYVLKKIKGKGSADYYGERVPPYVTMSRKPGIAADWFRTWKDDVYPNDYVVIRDGLKTRPPKYFDRLLSQVDDQEFKKVKQKRLKHLVESDKSKGIDLPRLRAGEIITTQKLGKVRDYDD